MCSDAVKTAPSHFESACPDTTHCRRAAGAAEIAIRRRAGVEEYKGAKHEAQCDSWRRQAEIDAMKRVTLLLTMIWVGLYFFYTLLDSIETFGSATAHLEVMTSF